MYRLSLCRCVGRPLLLGASWLYCETRTAPCFHILGTESIQATPYISTTFPLTRRGHPDCTDCTDKVAVHALLIVEVHLLVLSFACQSSCPPTLFWSFTVQVSDTFLMPCCSVAFHVLQNGRRRTVGRRCPARRQRGRRLPTTTSTSLSSATS